MFGNALLEMPIRITDVFCNIQVQMTFIVVNKALLPDQGWLLFTYLKFVTNFWTLVNRSYYYVDFITEAFQLSNQLYHRHLCQFSEVTGTELSHDYHTKLSGFYCRLRIKSMRMLSDDNRKTSVIKSIIGRRLRRRHLGATFVSTINTYHPNQVQNLPTSPEITGPHLSKLHECRSLILLPLLRTDSRFGSSDGTLQLCNTASSDLPTKTQQALFTKVLSDDTV